MSFSSRTRHDRLPSIVIRIDEEYLGVKPFLFNVIARGSPEMPEQKQVQALVREI